jgi:hypothetical protein
MTGCLANAYLKHRVGFNVQDAFLERDPSADGLTCTFTHMSIRSSPEVPKEVPEAELDQVPADPEITELARRARQMFISTRQEYGMIKRAREQVLGEYRQLRRDLKNTKSFLEEMTGEYQDACRHCIYNKELKRQLKELVQPEKVEPAVQHGLEGRTEPATGDLERFQQT